MAVKRDKSSPWEFLWYALYAFAGLGLELVLMGGVEPALFGGTPPSRYTAAHTLLHWGMTMACWGLTAALLVRQAEKKLGFSLLEARPVPRKGAGLAIGLAALCNLLGVLCVTAVNTSVAETIYSIASFGGGPRAALAALCAAMASIVLWAAAAWWFGIPTSESHALVAGISGAAAALEGSLSCIRWDCWARVVLGLLVSVGAGFWAGRRALRALSRLSWSDRLFRRAQIPGAALTAFLHGAQDGQKFLGVFLLGAALAQGGGVGQTFSVPGWLMLLCAAVMALGTAMGGRRIIETVGRDMVILAPREGLAADLGGGLCLLLCTLAGLPVSTTHAKTAAILGAGSAGGGTVNHRVAARIALTWLFTFPGCGLLGFLLASLFRSPLSCGILMPGTIF